jgi:hypothetical protein
LALRRASATSSRSSPRTNSQAKSRLIARATPNFSQFEMPFDGDYTQDAYAQQMIDEYKAAGIAAADVFPQSFQLRDVLYWIKADPEFGAQAVYLDDRNDTLEGFDPMTPETFADDAGTADQASRSSRRRLMARGHA